MSGRKLGVSGHRSLTLEERVNIAEGEDSLSDSDNLDMVSRKHRHPSLDDFIDSVGDKVEDVIEVSSGAEEGNGDDTKNKRGNHRTEQGTRLAFDDDDDSDTAYQNFKKRKSEHRKQVAASTNRARRNIKNASLVGRKPKTVIKTRETSNRHRDRRYGDHSDDDDDTLLEDALPSYLKERRSSFDQRYEDMKAAGLQTPPDFEDVYFSDDDRMVNLEEKPRLPTWMVQTDYKDVELRYSLGIIPAPIAQYLRPYQVKGAEFLHELFVYQKGGILGDDMGLGKTIQVIAFLTAAFGKTADERDAKRMRKMRRMGGDDRWYPRVLIVAPGGLMANWRAELDRWGWWQTYMYHGTPAEKTDALAAATKGRLEIMITTYATYRLHQSELNGIRWDCVIADECHIIKEKGSEITKAMNDINALCRIGLSGTAIQNKYEELWTLLNWTNPGKFGALGNWKQMICIPLKMGQSHDATVPQLAKSRRTAEKLVKNLLPPFFLRRTKALIAHQLPKKSDVVVFCPLTETQAQAYDNFCDSEMVRIIREASEPCTCGSGKKQGWCCYTEIDDDKWQIHVFPCMMTLQKLANHIALLIPSAEMEKEKHERELAKLKIALPDQWKTLYQQRDSIITFANQEFCGKWRVLKKLLKLWHSNDDKVLIFSHSVRLLKMLQTLFNTTTAYNVSYLDGAMSYADRQAAVDEYNSDPSQFVFLISTKAGGVGLNITSANKVVVVDPNWNPSYDLQAQDRAYRIGQTRDVDVFRLVSQGTVEEIVYARQIYKQQQANIGYNASVERRYFKGVQDQKEMKGEIFGLQNLFMPLSDNVKLRDIVNKTNVAETRAGVEIAGLDLEASQEDEDGFGPLADGAREDEAMSQLAASIIDEPAAKRKAAKQTAKRKDPVSAILASVGVEYTHENAEVIGTSKIETKISSRAQKAGNDIDYLKDKAFGRDESQLDDAESSASKHANGAADLDGADHHDGLGTIRYKYHPSQAIRKRQFCTMAKRFGYDDVTEFALVVEGWTQEQRRDCLERFYRDRRAELAG